MPKLNPNGSNFLEWRAAWTIAFKAAGYADILSGEQTRPAVTDPANCAAWDRQDARVRVLLIGAVHPDLINLVVDRDDARDAWSALSDRFDRDTYSSFLCQFRELNSLRLDENGDLLAHINAFNRLWTRLARRTLFTQCDVVKHFKDVFQFEINKGVFFLVSLPQSMDHVVETLTKRNVPEYNDIEKAMLDMVAWRMPTGER